MPGTGPRPTAALLRKEWAVLQPRYRAGIVVVFLLGALQTVRSDEAFLWLGILLAGALALAVPVIEWRLDADRLLASLPVGRSSIVRARYLVAGTGCLAAWGAWVAAGSVLAPFLAAGHIGPRIWADVPGALTFFALAGLLLGTFLPLQFRLGLGRAAVAFVPIGLGLVLAAGEVAGSLTTEARLGDGMAADRVSPGVAIRQAAVELTARFGAGVAVALVAVGLLGFVALSARVSARAYGRREL